MNCDKCNIKNRPGEYCLVCWKKKEPDYRVLSVDVARVGTNNHLMYTYSHVFTAGSTTNISWNTTSDWDDEDWYITTTGYTR